MLPPPIFNSLAAWWGLGPSQPSFQGLLDSDVQSSLLAQCIHILQGLSLWVIGGGEWGMQ